QIVDGTQLVLATWPDQLTMPTVDPDTTWRNRIAHAIFDAELIDGVAPLPWEMIGVAIGLVAFNVDWHLEFLDRNAVVRSGGRGLRQPLGHPTTGDFVFLPRAAAESRLLQL